MSGSDEPGGFPLFSRLLSFVGGKQRASETKSGKKEPICNGIVKGYEVISDRRSRKFGNNVDDSSLTNTTFAGSASGDFNLTNEYHRPKQTASVTRRGSLVLPRFKNVKREEQGCSTSLLVPNSPASSSKAPPAYQTKYANFGHMPSVRLGTYSKPLFQPKSEVRAVVKIAPPDPLRRKFFEPLQPIESCDDVKAVSTASKIRKSGFDSYDDDLQESLSKRRKLFNTEEYVVHLSSDVEDQPIRRGLKRPALKEREGQGEIEGQHNMDPSPSLSPSFHSVERQQTKRQKLQTTPVKLWNSTRNPIEVSMLSMKKYYERKNRETTAQSQDNCSLHSSRESSIHHGPVTEVQGLAEFSCSLTPSESVSLRGESGASTPLCDNVLDVGGRAPRLSLISREGSTKKRLTPCLEKDQQRMWAERTSRKGVSVKDYEEDRRHNESSKISFLIGTVGQGSDGHLIEKRLAAEEKQSNVQRIDSMSSTATVSMKLPSNNSAATTDSAKLPEAVRSSQINLSTTTLTLTSPTTSTTASASDTSTMFKVSTASFQMPTVVPLSQNQKNDGVTGSVNNKFPDIVASTPLNKQKESQITSIQTESIEEQAPQTVQLKKSIENPLEQATHSTSSQFDETRQNQGFASTSSNHATQQCNDKITNFSAPETSTMFSFSTSTPLLSSPFSFGQSNASTVAATNTTTSISSTSGFKPSLPAQPQPNLQTFATGSIQQSQSFQTPGQNALPPVQDQLQDSSIQPVSLSIFKTPALDSNLNKNTSVANGTGTTMFKETSLNLTSSNSFSVQTTSQQSKVPSQSSVLSPMQGNTKMPTLFGSQQGSTAASNFFATSGQNSTQSSNNQLNLFGTKQPVSEPSTLNFQSQQSNQKSFMFGQQNTTQPSNGLFTASQKDSLFSTPSKQNSLLPASSQNDTNQPSSRSGTTSLFDPKNQSSFQFGQQQQTSSQQSGSNLFKFGQQTTNSVQGDQPQVNSTFKFGQQQPVSQQSAGGFNFNLQQQTNQNATSQSSVGGFKFGQQQSTNQQASSQPSAGVFNFGQQQQSQSTNQQAFSQPSSSVFNFDQQQSTNQQASSQPSAGVFNFGQQHQSTSQQASSKSSAGGFNFGQQQQTNPQQSISQPSSGGFKFDQQLTNTVQNEQAQVNGTFKFGQQQQQPNQQQTNVQQLGSGGVFKFGQQPTNTVQGDASQVNSMFKFGQQQVNTEQQNSVFKFGQQPSNVVQNESSHVNNSFKFGQQQPNLFNFQSSASGMAATTQNPMSQPNANFSFGNTQSLPANQLAPPGEKKSFQFGNNGGLNLATPQYNIASSNSTVENKGTAFQFGGTNQPTQAFSVGANNFSTFNTGTPVGSFTFGATTAQKPSTLSGARMKRKPKK